MNEQQYREFIDEIVKNCQIWLLESKPGLFAMLEDESGQSYVPIWECEASAVKAAADEWAGYTVASMDFNELAVWLKELQTDEIHIMVGGPEGQLSLMASALHRMIKPFVTEKFVDTDPEEQD